MSRSLSVGLLALSALLAPGLGALAQSPPVPPPPVPLLPAPEPPGAVGPPPKALPPALPPVVVTPAPPMTHQEFARIFKPMPGTYEVVLVHPGTRRPVPVSFTLPDGHPRVKVHRRELVFDYGRRHQVTVRFAVGGRVRVVNR
jgi:hypothetical protein